MTTPTEPIREEHRHLLPHIEEIRTAADAVGAAPADRVRAAAEEVHTFLLEHLIPHAESEDGVLYPAVEDAMGAPGATRTMTRDHVEVGTLTGELGKVIPRLEGDPGREVEDDLRRILYGLHALVTLHFAKEEEIYLPILDTALTVEEGEHLIHRMHGEH